MTGKKTAEKGSCFCSPELGFDDTLFTAPLWEWKILKLKEVTITFNILPYNLIKKAVWKVIAAFTDLFKINTCYTNDQNFR